MKQCIYCGAELEDDARACNNCGRPVPDMPEKPEPADLNETPMEELAVEETPAEEPVQPVQPQQQDPWGQPQQQQSLWGQQPQQQDPQSLWGQQQPQQNPWGQPQQQGPQNPWGQPMNGSDPNRPGYGGQIPGYGMPYNGQDGRPYIQKRYHVFAVWSLVFGILAVFLNGVVFIPSILAIVFAILAILKIRKEPQLYGGTVLAIVGLVLGIVFLIMYGYVFKMVFQAVQNPETMEQLQNYLQEISRR